jgi:hypothetical protein
LVNGLRLSRGRPNGFALQGQMPVIGAGGFALSSAGLRSTAPLGLPASEQGAQQRVEVLPIDPGSHITVRRLAGPARPRQPQPLGQARPALAHPVSDSAHPLLSGEFGEDHQPTDDGQRLALPLVPSRVRQRRQGRVQRGDGFRSQARPSSRGHAERDMLLCAFSLVGRFFLRPGSLFFRLLS